MTWSTSSTRPGWPAWILAGRETVPGHSTVTTRTSSSRRPPPAPRDWQAAKTLHILRLADEPGYRHRIKVQAKLQEGRNALARKIFHGRAGQL